MDRAQQFFPAGKSPAKILGSVMGQAMPQHLPGYKISRARGETGVGIPRSEKDGNKLFRSQIGSRQLQQYLLVFLAPSQPLGRQEQMAVQGNFRINPFAEKDGQSLGHNKGVERTRRRR